jgi:lon-related putative ATP-dependent protease
MIKAGALHRANGGYLVLPAEAVVRDPVSWEGVKRALRSREIPIEDLGERMGFVAIKSLRPQPMPLDVKVLLVGHPQLYALLHAHDGEFPELFKVKADFDTRMACNDENIQDFLRFLCTLCCKEELRHMDHSAVAKVLEHAVRLAEDQTKLSTQFGMLADLVREAHFWARQEEVPFVSAAHVRKAIEAKVSRVNLIQEHMQEMITRGTLFIDTTGHAVGQVNGLSVLSLGDSLFGRPSRITASVGPGREGIIDIEREVSLGGPLHSKGILILSGYLAQQYAQDKPLTLVARLVFEQSYEGVEGDSASSAELYALLSALSGIPIRQGMAVTGSVNQHGEVQAIGGVNQKIEGFFDVCKAKGFTGDQGVLIPYSNMPHLMLREDVVDAVTAQQFHVWAVKTIDAGMEILTGMSAGRFCAGVGGFSRVNVGEVCTGAPQGIPSAHSPGSPKPTDSQLSALGAGCEAAWRISRRAVVSAQTGREIADDVHQCGELPVVRFWDLDSECLIEADEEVEVVEGINVQRLAHVLVGAKCAEVSLRSDLPQHLENGLFELCFGHSVAASCR